MATFYALHDVEAKEKGEVMVVKGHDKALKAVNLDEPRAQVYLGCMGGEQDQHWYLDSGASNHMTGSKEGFSELDGNMTDTVKFGDGSRVAIRGHDTIIFRCQNGEHSALTDVYYIPQLRSSIISIGQLGECGCDVLIESRILMIRDRERHLLTKVEHPVCLTTRHTKEPWLWYARFGHLSFNALGRLEKMVRGLPHIKHTSELCDSCLARK
ncbi:uncharacterized protein [Miscanthus floridulus]|uniref:uncharacterized protein n=1 Tax=Miscanthus floridulus TaxID=154761 RepID=UPI0034584877